MSQNSLLHKIKNTFNGPVMFTFTNYAFKLVFKFLLLIFVPLYLSKDVMGYWYTFISVAALTTIADLGFTTIITQFSAHEAVYLDFDSKKRIFSSESHELGRISSLFRFSIKWSGLATIICSVVILVVGILVFSNDSGHNADWFAPWIMYSFASSFNFFLQVLLAFFEGLNQIRNSQIIKIIDGILQNGLAIIFLLLGFGLFSLAIPLVVSTIVTFVQIFIFYHKCIFNLIKNKLVKDNFWVKSILSLLWKYAISWGAGYLIFQIYNPIVFMKYGSEVAADVGYIITIVSAFVSIANVWSYVSVPKINMYTERRDWKSLDKDFMRNLILICSTFSLEVCVCIMFIFVPPFSGFFGKYIYSCTSLIILCVGYLFQLITSYIGVYLRSHKKEPLLFLSLFTAILSAGLTILAVYVFPIDYIFIGFSISVAISLPITFFIKRRKQSEWHLVGGEFANE